MSSNNPIRNRFLTLTFILLWFSTVDEHTCNDIPIAVWRNCLCGYKDDSSGRFLYSYIGPYITHILKTLFFII